MAGQCVHFLFREEYELANRLPSALAGLIILLVTFLLGEKLFSLRVGFLSAMVLGTCILFPQLSRWMMLDSLFTLFFLLTLFCFYLGYDMSSAPEVLPSGRPLYRACHLDERAYRIPSPPCLFDLSDSREDELLVPRSPPGISPFRIAVLQPGSCLL